MRTLLLLLLLASSNCLSDDTLVIPISTAWVNVSGALLEGTIQNTGSRDIFAAEATVQPASNAAGHVVNPKISVLFSDLAGAFVWVRTSSGLGSVAVTGDN